MANGPTERVTIYVDRGDSEVAVSAEVEFLPSRLRPGGYPVLCGDVPEGLSPAEVDRIFDRATEQRDRRLADEQDRRESV